MIRLVMGDYYKFAYLDATPTSCITSPAHGGTLAKSLAPGTSKGNPINDDAKTRCEGTPLKHDLPLVSKGTPTKRQPPKVITRTSNKGKVVEVSMGTPSKDEVPQNINKGSSSKRALKLYKSKGDSTTTTIEPQKSKGGPTKDKVPLKNNSSPIKEEAYASSGTPCKDKTLKNIQPKDSKGNTKSNVKRPILIVPTKFGFKS